MPPIRRRLDVALAGMFVLALLAPAGAWMCNGIPGTRRLPEERLSTPFPETPRDLVQISDWSRGFEAWLGDALGLRRTLLHWRSRILVDVFRTSPTSACLLDRDDWVFLTADRSLDAERGTWPLSKFEVDRWFATLNARAHFCKEHGADYLFVLVPDKPWVYADRMPAALARVGPSRLDQIAARLAGDDVLLDLRAPIAEARRADVAGDHAFFPFGSHWTSRGMLAGLHAILVTLRTRPRFASLREFAPENIGWWTDPGFEGDNWAPRLYLEGRLSVHERSIGYIHDGPEPEDVAAESTRPMKVVTKLDDPTLPRILVFHDSFGEPMRPLIAQRASRAVCLWGEDFSPQIVTAEKPDLVLELFVDRKLARLPVQNLPELESLAQVQFDAAKETAFVLDPDRDLRAMEAHAVEIQRTAGGLHVRALERGILRLPAESVPKDATENTAHALVRFDVDAEQAGTLLLLYRMPDSDGYLRRNSIARPVSAGRSAVYVDLGIPGIRGPLALSTDIGGAPFTLEGVEVRLQR